MNNIDNVIKAMQAAVSVRNPAPTALDDEVEGWACEKLSEEDCDAFFAAIASGRYIAAHGILTAHGLCWPWRRSQFDRWLASHST